jgi:hypothetical protein
MSAAERLANPEAVFSRSDLRELGYERSAVDAIFRACLRRASSSAPALNPRLRAVGK